MILSDSSDPKILVDSLQDVSFVLAGNGPVFSLVSEVFNLAFKKGRLFEFEGHAVTKED